MDRLRTIQETDLRRLWAAVEKRDGRPVLRRRPYKPPPLPPCRSCADTYQEIIEGIQKFHKVRHDILIWGYVAIAFVIIVVAAAARALR